MLMNLIQYAFTATGLPVVALFVSIGWLVYIDYKDHSLN